METVKTILYSPHQAKEWMGRVWPIVKGSVANGERIQAEFKPTTRSLEQNALLHAELTEIASKLEWAGKKRDIEVWKRLLTAAWLRARGESVEILPALDGHGVDVVFRRTSSLTVSEMTELIEYILAWKANALS